MSTFSDLKRRGWQRHNNVLALPTGWQRPVRTEEWAYEQSLGLLPDSEFAELICFPWATLIDLQRRGKLAGAQPFIDALEATPPKQTLRRGTVCQHIYAEDLIPWFLRLEITDVYWAHKRLSQPLFAGIRLHPFVLYPVRAMAQAERNCKPYSERRFLYSFVGAYSAGLYLSPARKWILDIPERDDAYVVLRDQWHYETQVYQQQIAGNAASETENCRIECRGLEYDEVMRESVFVLCPSGSGPNSIRLWESLGFGCIPVIIKDDLQLPGEEDIWEQAAVRIPEEQSAILSLPSRLEELSSDGAWLKNAQAAVDALWERYGVNGPATILSEFVDPKKIRQLYLDK